MSQQKQLQMMTFIPKALTIKTYAVGFPPLWKECLAELAFTANPKYDYDKYNLPLCSALSQICSNWVHGLIEINGMRKGSDDSKWIVCLKEINESVCQDICINLQAAAQSFYFKYQKNDRVQEVLSKFINLINPQELLHYVNTDHVEIIDENGIITSQYAYNGFCLKLMESMIGKSIIYDNTELVLNYSGRNELMSQVIKGYKGDLYAYVFSFGLQTIPGREATSSMLLLNCSRRIFKNTSARSKKYLRNNMSVYVKHNSKPIYYKITMLSNYNQVTWKDADESCYNFAYPNSLPKADDVMNRIEFYNDETKSNPQIYCTCSTENSFSSESKIGTGISALDKVTFYNAIYELIKESVSKSDPLSKVKARAARLNPAPLKEDKNTWAPNGIDICECLSKTGFSGARIEIYSFSNDNELAKKIEDGLKVIIDKNTEDFGIDIQRLPLKNFADPILIQDYNNISQRTERIRQVSESIGPAPGNLMVGSIIILPKNQDDKNVRDAKDLLRCGFALTNRVTQFINPIDENDIKEVNGLSHKISVAIYDLLRQFGYTKRATKLDKFLKYPILAVGAHSNAKTMSGATVRAVPMLLKYNISDRLITVECPAVNNGLPTSYYQACIELCKLSMNRDCDKLCLEGSKRYIEQKIKGLENYYRYQDAIVIVSGDGFVRSELWPGISNKKISTYAYMDDYRPLNIDIGNKICSVPFNLNNSKLRIVRIRYNDEIPNYYFTDGCNTTGFADGIFKYREVYYASVTEKKNDRTYSDGNKEYSYSNSNKLYRRKKLSEYFPLSLCENDDSFEVINFLNQLRYLSPEYNSVTNLPMPLHYLNLIKEYIDFS
ncbi:MAG: DUF3962 domain-containing protein [Clostridia bacterium]|nr:DUF3962 domain-containing protein [Clostridia bacterium]